MSRARDLADGTFSGAFSADSPTLVVDADNNRVGINTISPASPLQVEVSRTSSTNAIALHLSDGVTGVQTDGVYKAIRSQSNGGASVSELRFIETDGTNNNTAIAFATSASAGALSEKMRVLPSGGITFNGDTAAANALDDYEEGSWTPGIAGTTSGVKTMGSNNIGRYTKIGQQVTVTGTIEVSGTETISGLVMITGLPFTSRNLSQLRHGAAVTVNTLCNLSGASKRLTATLDHNQSSVWLMEQDDDTATYSHTPPVGNSGAIYGFTLSYITDA